jgi:putative sterol carrier protein
MAGVFPSQEWLDSFIEYLNADEKYAKTAKNWEGDIVFDIEIDETLPDHTRFYLDLWHGKCRGGKFMSLDEEHDCTFILNAPYGNFARILKGELDPMQAMMTRKLVVKGSMAYMMRNVPTVLEFVRCARDVTDKVLGE